MKKGASFLRIMSCVIALSVVFSQLPLIGTPRTAAAEASEVWDGTKASTFAGGTGTADDPYLIENGAQLYKMVAEYSTYAASHGQFFKITKDIYLNNVTDGASIVDLSGKKNWMANYGTDIPSPSAANSFNGTLDGSYYTIYGLYASGSSGSNASLGLFAAISSYAVIKNLTFDNLLLTGGRGYGGAIAGQAIYYAWQSAAQITNCRVKNATIGQWKNLQSVGGFLGQTTSCSVTFTDCCVYDVHLSDDNTPGGIVGAAWSDGTLTLKNCYSVGYFPTHSANNKAVCTNVYTDTAQEGNTTANVTLLSSEQMRGEAAKQAMSGLNFDTLWETSDDGYPVLASAWDGLPAKEFAGGTGTKADPFLIENGGQLYKMVKEYSNTSVSAQPSAHTYFQITKDINLGGEPWCWYGAGCGPETYISKVTAGFSGIIYGDGHTISNLTSENKANYAEIGLIPIGTRGAEVHNLTIKSANLSGQNVGAVLFSLVKATENNVSPIVIDRCSIEDSSVTMNDTAGGFVGYVWGQSVRISNSRVVRSTFAATGSGMSARAAAFAGSMNNGDNVWEREFTVSASFCDDVKPVGPRSDGDTWTWTQVSKFENVYTSNASPVDGIKKLDDALMKGEAAKTNMTGLNYNQIWQTQDADYPAFFDYDLYWDGTIAARYAGGTGAETDPYLISNARELALLANSGRDETFGKYFKLTNNIQISRVYENWQEDAPISWLKKTAYLDGYGYSNSFAGFLDGAGHTVSGLYFADTIDDGGSYAYGMLPLVGADAVLVSLTVKDTAANVDGGTSDIGDVAGAVCVSEADAQQLLKWPQFVDVTADGERYGNADARGVKVDESYSSDAGRELLAYNTFTTDDDAVATIRGYLLGKKPELYITDVTADDFFDIRDLVTVDNYLSTRP